MTSDSSTASTFEQHRDHCFGVAYRMLGSVADAEDLVQESWLRFEKHAASIDDPRAWLTRVMTRLSIDRLREASRRREDYVGPWLPTPLIGAPTQAESVAAAESISFAFMVLLEQLGPVERAVFLLRAVFDRDYEDIAEIVGKEVANCRQIYARARKHIDAGQPRFEVPKQEHLAVLAAFSDAARRNDVDALVEVLGPSVRLTSDGGGKVAAALKPLEGAAKVAKFLLGVAQVHERQGGSTLEPCMVNGRPGAIVRMDGKVDAAMSVDMYDGQIAAIHIVRNPDKLQHLS